MTDRALIERLCRCLAFHVVETEITVHFMDGDIDDIRAEIETGKSLIQLAGFDIDKLYPQEDRPTATAGEH